MRQAIVMAGLLAAVAGCSSDSKLKVFGVEPNSGDYQGGTTVDIKGNGYTQNGTLGAKVYFGDRQGVVIKFDGDADLYVTAPGGKKGETVDVKVMFEGKGPITVPKAFTFVETKNADVNDLGTTGSGK
jgi:hypothetical protein